MSARSSPSTTRPSSGLPDHTKLKNVKLPGLSTVLDVKGSKYAELFEADNRRIWVPLAEIPVHVQNAFIAAEDKRFYKHKGVDERSVIRAFMSTMADPKKRQGGSTITQQVAKNLLVGDDVTYERKIREIIVAARVEQALSKSEILEIYLNAIFLGRSSWGIEMAARSYFGKSASKLTIAEGAFLAGLTKGPNYYNPDRYRDRAHERLAYVLDRMLDDGVIDAAQMKQAQADRLAVVAFTRPRRDSGFALVEHLRREAGTLAGVGSLTAASYEVHSTIHPQIQWAAEIAVQEGLARYEQRAGRVNFKAAEGNLTEAIKRVQADPKADRTKPAWRVALEAARTRLYDVHWQKGVVVEKLRLKSGHESIMVGLSDGRTLPLSTWGGNTRRIIGLNDLIFVNVVEGKGKEGTRLELRTPADRAGVRRRAGEPDRAHPRHGRRVLVPAEPAQPRDPDPPAARLRVQADDLPRGAQRRPAAQHAGGGRADHAAADRQFPIRDGQGLVVAEKLRRRLFRHHDAAPRTRAFEEPRHRAPARRRHRRIAAGKPRPDLQARNRGAALSALRTLLPVRARRPTGAADRPRGVLRVDRERRRAPDPAHHRVGREGRPHDLQAHRQPDLARLHRQPAAYQLKSILQGVVARGTARFDEPPFAVHRRQDRHQRRGKRRLVRRLQQRRHGRGLGRLRQRPRQAHARLRADRRQGGGADLRADHAGGVGEARQKTALRGPTTEAAKQLVALPIDLHSVERG